MACSLTPEKAIRAGRIHRFASGHQGDHPACGTAPSKVWRTQRASRPCPPSRTRYRRSRSPAGRTRTTWPHRRRRGQERVFPHRGRHATRALDAAGPLGTPSTRPRGMGFGHPSDHHSDAFPMEQAQPENDHHGGRSVNRLLRGLRQQGERGFAILTGRWKTPQNRRRRRRSATPHPFRIPVPQTNLAEITSTGSRLPPADTMADPATEASGRNILI